MADIDIIYSPQRPAQGSTKAIPVTYTSHYGGGGGYQPQQQRQQQHQPIIAAQYGADGSLESPRRAATNGNGNGNGAAASSASSASIYDRNTASSASRQATASARAQQQRQSSLSPMRRTYMSGVGGDGGGAPPLHNGAGASARRAPPAAAPSSSSASPQYQHSHHNHTQYAQSKSVFDRIYDRIVNQQPASNPRGEGYWSEEGELGGGGAGGGYGNGGAEYFSGGEDDAYYNGDYDDDGDRRGQQQHQYTNDTYGQYIRQGEEAIRQASRRGGGGNGASGSRAAPPRRRSGPAAAASATSSSSAVPPAAAASGSKTPFRVTNLKTHHKLFKQDATTSPTTSPLRRAVSPAGNNGPRYADPTTASSLKSRRGGGGADGMVMDGDDGIEDGAEIEAMIPIVSPRSQQHQQQGQRVRSPPTNSSNSAAAPYSRNSSMGSGAPPQQTTRRAPAPQPLNNNNSNTTAKNNTAAAAATARAKAAAIAAAEQAQEEAEAEAAEEEARALAEEEERAYHRRLQREREEARQRLAEADSIDQHIIANYLPTLRGGGGGGGGGLNASSAVAAAATNTSAAGVVTPQASSVNASSLHPNGGAGELELPMDYARSSSSTVAGGGGGAAAISSSMLTSPLRHLSRHQLAEQLSVYAKAYATERDANDVATRRIEELGQLADTSTTMAEESDRNCKTLLERLEEAGANLTSTNAKLVDALEENARLRSFLGEAKTRFDEGEQRIAMLRQTNAGLEELLRPLQKEHEKMRLEHESFSQEVLTLKAKHELALQTQSVKHETEADHLRQTVARLEREVKDLRDGLADLESAHQRERKETGLKLTDAYADADKTKAALETVRAELRTVSESAENERTSHLRQEQVYVQEVESLKARITAATAQYDQCSNRRNELEREMVAMRDAHNAMTAKVKTTLAELETTDAEKESKKMLERQNLEMERQILDLRATLQTFMTTRRVQ